MHIKKILFLGTHGQHNIGDELLLETFLSQLGDQHQYCINSYDPTFTTEQLAGKYNVQVFHTTQDKWQLPAHILQNDLLFFGGGSIIKELYQSVGRNRYGTLMMILMIVIVGHIIARKPIIMSNIGVGPLQTKLGHLLARLILYQVDYISVRDQKSYDTCLDLGLDPRKLIFAPDAVFVHDAAFFTAKSKTGSVKKHNIEESMGKLKIALNLNYNIENPDNWERFTDNLAQSLRLFHRQQPIEIVALPMQSRFKSHNDLDMLADFRQKIAGIDMSLYVLTTPQGAAQIIADCDMVVAERLHALITAAILGKPFVALMYDVKVRELVKILKMEAFAIDINHPFNPATLTRKLLALNEQHARITDALNRRTSELRTQLRDYFQMLNQRITAEDRKASPPVQGGSVKPDRRSQTGSEHFSRALDD